MKLFRLKLNPGIHLGMTFWSFLFIAGFLLFTRWLFDEPFFLNSLYVVLMYVVIAFLYVAFALDKISIERKSRYLRRQVGDLFEENLIISNRLVLPIFWMQIRDLSELNRSHANRIIGFLGGHQFRIIRLDSFLQKRGDIVLSPIEVRTSDPLGCFYSSHQIKTSGKLIILPYRIDLSSLQIKNRQSEEGRSARMTLQQSSMISASVRNYLDGDPFNRIHWPTTARRGSLHTKLPDVNIQQMVWICMDCEHNAHVSRFTNAESENIDFFDTEKKLSQYALPPDTVEAAVSITSSLAVTWLKKGIAVGLTTNNQPEQMVLPGFGIRQQAEILNMLTFIQANSRIPLATMLMDFSSQLQPGNICFLVTPEDSQNLIQTIKMIKQKGIDLRVIHVNRASYIPDQYIKHRTGDWKTIRCLHFNYGDPLSSLISIL
jgi:uncharacterized protein (DUF58 family)